MNATSHCYARTSARNWRLSQSEAMISCSRENPCSCDTHAPMTLMLQGQPELMTHLWRSHHNLKATCRGLSYCSAQKVLDSIKFFFERVSHNYIIVLLNFYYCLILVEILIFFLINIYHPVLRAIYRTSWYTHSVVFGVWFREGLKKNSGKFHLGGGSLTSDFH